MLNHMVYILNQSGSQTLEQILLGDRGYPWWAPVVTHQQMYAATIPRQRCNCINCGAPFDAMDKSCSYCGSQR